MKSSSSLRQFAVGGRRSKVGLCAVFDDAAAQCGPHCTRGSRCMLWQLCKPYSQCHTDPFDEAVPELACPECSRRDEGQDRLREASHSSAKQTRPSMSC